MDAVRYLIAVIALLAFSFVPDMGHAQPSYPSASIRTRTDSAVLHFTYINWTDPSQGRFRVHAMYSAEQIYGLNLPEVVVQRSERLSIQVDQRPDTLFVTPVLDGRRASANATGPSFTAPDSIGLYHYIVTARWPSLRAEVEYAIRLRVN